MFAFKPPSIRIFEFEYLKERFSQREKEGIERRRFPLQSPFDLLLTGFRDKNVAI